MPQHMGGLSLGMTRAAMRASVLARGGVVTAEDDQGLRVSVDGEDIAARFAPGGDTPSQIAALRKEDSMETFLAMVLRFGTPLRTYPYPERHWEGRDGVWAVYRPGRPDTDDRQEIRLMSGPPENV